MDCPRCDGTLLPKMYEGIEIDSCDKCEGDWLDITELSKVIEKQEKSFSKQLIDETVNNTFAGIPKEEFASKEKCPRCQKLMTPVNHSYSSGVILDICSEHGVWLDKSELDKIQINRETFSKKFESNKDQWHENLQKIQDQQPIEDSNEGPSMFSFINRIINSFINK